MIDIMVACLLKYERQNREQKRIYFLGILIDVIIHYKNESKEMVTREQNGEVDIS